MSGPAADRLERSRELAPSTDIVVGVAPPSAAVSWGAIMVGAVVAISFAAMLNVLGAAVGASSIDATARNSPAASTLTFGAGLWLAVSAAVGLLLGSMVASRLAGTWQRAAALLHGFGVWSVTFLIAILVVGGTVSGVTLAAIRGASGAATGVATGLFTAGAAAAGAGAAATDQSDTSGFAAMLERRLAAPQDPATVPRERVVAEFGDLITRRLAVGNWQPADRERAELLLATAANISPADARVRLEQAETELRARADQAAETARRAADTAAAAAALAAFWAFATMLIGLGAAAAGAWLGARQDEFPSRPAYPASSLA